MTPEIKHRIEQIKRGEVPKGYMKTKVGIVPEEWEIKQLSQVLKKQTRKNTDNSIHNVLTNSATQGIISQRDYFDKQIANDENTDGYYIVENGYFVYNPRISVSAPCGPFNKYYGNDTGIMSPLYTVYKFLDKSPCYSEYLSYYYSSTNWHRYMNEIANYGARSDRMNVTSDDMDAMPLPYPPLVEQEKIAEILAAQDKVIALKEKLLEEKKKQKKYLMQQLLIGKKRLPGFSGDWGKVRFKDCIIEIDERTTQSGQYEILSVTKNGIEKQTEHFNQQIASKDNSGYKILKYNQLAFSVLNLWMGSLGVLKSSQIGIISPAYKVYDFTNKMSPDFGKYFLRSHNIVWLYNINSEVGASVVRKNLDLNSLMNCIIQIPSINEQVKIAEIIDFYDKEISIIQKSIDQEKQKKKALMQLLLTGIVRTK